MCIFWSSCIFNKFKYDVLCDNVVLPVFSSIGWKGSYETHFKQVLSGDSVDLIVSVKYQNLTTTAAVINSSHLDSSGGIDPGDTLSIPVSCFCGDPSVSRTYGLFTTYVVRANDSLTGVATAFSVPADFISRFNSDVQVLTPNSIIFIPSRGMSQHIVSRWLCDSSLSYLTSK